MAQEIHMHNLQQKHRRHARLSHTRWILKAKMCSLRGRAIVAEAFGGSVTKTSALKCNIVLIQMYISSSINKGFVLGGVRVCLLRFLAAALVVTVFRVSSISFSCTSLTAGASLELDISSSMDAQITNNKPNAVVDIFLINLFESWDKFEIGGSTGQGYL